MLKSELKSNREIITNTLRSEILCGEWPNDIPVREHALAKRFGVSRGPIRDSLLQLSQEGVLAYKANKGVRVSSPPDEAQRQLLQALRRQIELFCLESCINNLNDTDDSNLQQILDALAIACGRGKLTDIAEKDLALHRYLVRRSSNELESVWLGITSRLLMDYSRIGQLDEIVTEHCAIVDAIKKRDLRTAQKALLSNII
ncbi:MAG: GntR family transcriptional regulator [Verrucomicrobiaceae bacterium]|nr:GntR family transcriptional regulator [Verrucomicrobiaceae bacterium]